MARRYGLLVLLGFLLCACSAEPDVTNRVPQDQFGFASQFVSQIQAGAVDAALTSLDPSVDRDRARAFLENAAESFPKRPILATRVIDWVQVFQNSQGVVSTVSSGAPNEITRYRMVLRYVFSDSDALDVLFVLAPSDQSYFVSLVNFQPRTQADIDANAFLAPGKSILNYIYFLAALAIFAFILATLYFCVRGPAPRWRWRWLWVLFILLGIGRFSMVWTTGNLTISPLGAVLFGLEFRKLGVFGPWVFFTGLPVGAIVFWIFRRRWMKQQKLAMAAPQATAVEPDEPPETQAPPQ